MKNKCIFLLSCLLTFSACKTASNSAQYHHDKKINKHNEKELKKRHVY